MKNKVSVEFLEQENRALKQEITGLKKQLTVFKEMLNASMDAIVRHDADGCVEYVNPEFTRLFGWTLEELKGKKMNYYPQGTYEDTQVMMQRLGPTGEGVHSFSTSRYTKDGRILDVVMSSAAILDDEEMIGNVSIIREMTAQPRSLCQGV